MSDEKSVNEGECKVEARASGMEKLEIYRYQADIINDALRLSANALKSHRRETCLDRDVMQSWHIINAVLRKDIEPVVSRFAGNDTILAQGKDGFLHSHPKMEAVKKIDAAHVIVDRREWEKARDILSEPSVAVAVAEVVKRKWGDDHKVADEG